MTVKELYKAVKDKLAAGNIDSADFEARILICEMLGFLYQT